MILVDTSVWINHLRVNDPRLVSLLERNAVLIHPMVAGEPACGNLRDRAIVMRHLMTIPEIPTATHDEVMAFVERHQFMGHRIGFIDAHLLAATVMSPPTQLWTNDRRLTELSVDLRVAYP